MVPLSWSLWISRAFHVNGPITKSLMVPLSQLYWSRVRRAAQSHNLDVSQASGHLNIILRNPRIREELAEQGYSKEQLPPWVGTRIKTNETPKDPTGTSKDLAGTPPTPENQGGYPQDTQKTPPL